MYLSVLELSIAGGLTVSFIIYSAQNLTLIPLIVPITYLIITIRILENGSNLFQQLLKAFNYLINIQQIYKWGERKK